jgi:hypothetical protein
MHKNKGKLFVVADKDQMFYDATHWCSSIAKERLSWVLPMMSSEEPDGTFILKSGWQIDAASLL